MADAKKRIRNIIVPISSPTLVLVAPSQISGAKKWLEKEQNDLLICPNENAIVTFFSLD